MEIYTITGGDLFASVLNAIVSILGTSTWDSLLRIVLTFSVIVLLYSYIRTKDPAHFLHWFAIFIFINSICLIPKASVQIIDLSNTTYVNRVDNVPIGVAMPASIITKAGYGLAQLYDNFFHTPDSLTYTKTGMLFGANLVGKSIDFWSRNPEVNYIFPEYVRSCVVNDILINHKYTIQELTTSPDVFDLITSNPSPVRGIFESNGNFRTCAEAASILRNAINLDTNNMGQTFGYYATKIFGGKPDSNALFAQMLGDSYNYFYSSGHSATSILKQNIAMNALKNGMGTFAARSGDTSSLVNIATESSLSKMRLSWATSSNSAMVTLPLIHTTLMCLVIGLFPIIIAIASIGVLTETILKGFVYTILYLQLWQILFAILNHSMNFYLKSKLNGMEITLSNLNVIAQNHSDLSSVAGWLTLSIPFIAFGAIKGLGSVISQAGNYLNAQVNSIASASGSQAAEGNWSFNNMQHDNVNGFKWDTNFSHRNGQQTIQSDTGYTITQTGSGQSIVDSPISKLPVDINWSNITSSAYSKQARIAESQAESSMSGYRENVNHAFNQLTQLQTQTGNSNTHTQATDTSINANEQKAINDMYSAVVNYANDKNISKSEAFRQLSDMSERRSFSAGAKGEVSASGGFKLFGSGVEAKASAYTSGDISGSTATSHSATADNLSTTSQHTDQSSRYANDFKDSWNIIKSSRNSDSNSLTENASNSKLQQLSTALNQSDEQFKQYSSNKTKSAEFSRMASLSDTESAAMQSNYNQAFTNYLVKNEPELFRRLQNENSNPILQRELEMKAREFIDNELITNFSEHFNQPTNSNINKNSNINNDMHHSYDFTDPNEKYSNDVNTINNKANNMNINDTKNISEQFYANQSKNNKYFDEINERIHVNEHDHEKDLNNFKEQQDTQNKIFDEKYISEIKSQRKKQDSMKERVKESEEK